MLLKNIEVNIKTRKAPNLARTLTFDSPKYFSAGDNMFTVKILSELGPAT